MNLTELIKITSGTLIRKSSKQDIKNIKVDSRKIEKNDVFLAIALGHNYINQAIKNGAALIIVDRDIEIYKKVNILKVNNSIEALQKISNEIRKKYDPIVISVTGSAGKTTTKEMLYKVLSTKYNVIKNDGNENNHIGVPKTLLTVNKDTAIVITEMGMNHEGEIKLLSNIAEPDIAIITNIGTSHIGNLKSKTSIFKEKMHIVDGIKEGILIINQDDSCLKKIKSLKDIIIYRIGTKEDADLVAYALEVEDYSINAYLYIDGFEYVVSAISKPLLLDKLLVIQTALLFDMDIKDILGLLDDFKTSNNRLEQFEIGKTTVISDCYNASYESFVNVLDIIKRDKKNKILVLGDILELGKYSKKIHKKLGKKIRRIKNCQLILVGENVKYIKRYNSARTIWCSNNEEIKECLSVMDMKNKTILIKGSHAMHLEEITDYLKSQI